MKNGIERKTVLEKRLKKTGDDVRDLLVSLNQNGVAGMRNKIFSLAKIYEREDLYQVLEDAIICVNDLSGSKTECCMKGINLSLGLRRQATDFLQMIKRDFQ